MEPEILAGRIRGLDVVKDAKLARVVVSRLATDNDLIRETIHLVLLRSTEPEVLDVLREEGLGDANPLVRAGVARVLGQLRDAAARPRLEELLADRHWLVTGGRRLRAPADRRSRLPRRARQAARHEEREGVDGGDRRLRLVPRALEEETLADRRSASPTSAGRCA